MSATRYAIALTSEKGQPATSTAVLATVRTVTTRGLGQHRAVRYLSEPGSDRITTWAKRETAESHAAAFSKFPDLRTYAVVDAATGAVL